MTYPILHLSRQDMLHMKSGSKDNLNLHRLIIARSMDVIFKTDLFEVEQWTITGGTIPIRPYILASKRFTWFKKFKPFTYYPLFFIEQLFTNSTQPLAWRTFKELNDLSNKGRQVTWYDHLIVTLPNLESALLSIRAPDNLIPPAVDTQSDNLPNSHQSHYSNLHLWNFMKKCSKKRSAKPFVVFKTWDTNDRSVKAQQIYKIGKVTTWDQNDRATILIYQVSCDQDSEWLTVTPSSSSIRWIPSSESRLLTYRSQNS